MTNKIKIKNFVQHSDTYKLRNQTQVTCRVIQGFDTKLYLFLQLDKFVNLSSNKTFFFTIICPLLTKQT